MLSAAKITTEETSELGSQPNYMKKLLSIVRDRIQDSVFDITLKFTLSALWNLTDDSPRTCQVQLNQICHISCHTCKNNPLYIVQCTKGTTQYSKLCWCRCSLTREEWICTPVSLNPFLAIWRSRLKCWDSLTTLQRFPP